MTNGTITKKILVACKKQEGEELRIAVASLLSQFPLSSHKLVYDSDKEKVPTAAWKILIEACVESDQKKCDRKNRILTDAGMQLTKSDKKFGRYEG